MAQIAVFLQNNIVDGFVPEDFAPAQSKIKGWTLVDNDPAFSIESKSLWTIRQSDNRLVYVSDNKTSEERNQSTITELTKGHLNNQMTGAQLQTAVTALTKQNLQLTQDSANYKTAITALTQQIAELKLTNTTTTAESK